MSNLKYKNIFKILFFFFTLILLLIFAIQPFEKNLYSSSQQTYKTEEGIDCLSNYKVSVQLQSYEYFVYQQVPLTVEFQYNGNKVDSLDLNSYNLTSNVIVANSRGETTKWGGVTAYSNYVKFLPGEKKKFTFDILRNWSFAKFETPNLFGFYTYFPPDVYSVQFKITSSQVKSSTFMEKCNTDETIHSNIIRFKVIEPTGKNKEALEFVKEIYKVNKMGGKETDRFIKLANEFVKNYYNSIYIYPIYDELTATREYDNRYDASALEEAMIILENYPYDNISRLAIGQAFEYYKVNYNEERALQFLEETRQTYRNQEAGKWAEHELERIRGN